MPIMPYFGCNRVIVYIQSSASASIAYFSLVSNPIKLFFLILVRLNGFDCCTKYKSVSRFRLSIVFTHLKFIFSICIFSPFQKMLLFSCFYVGSSDRNYFHNFHNFRSTFTNRSFVYLNDLCCVWCAGTIENNVRADSLPTVQYHRSSRIVSEIDNEKTKENCSLLELGIALKFIGKNGR